jgi:acyl-CoA dehydrogenase
MAYGYALVCYEEALDWAKQRQTFGKRLIDHQVVRHKLVDMATQLTQLVRYWKIQLIVWEKRVTR